jgi:hypothetical protein
LDVEEKRFRVYSVLEMGIVKGLNRGAFSMVGVESLREVFEWGFFYSK